MGKFSLLFFGFFFFFSCIAFVFLSLGSIIVIIPLNQPSHPFASVRSLSLSCALSLSRRNRKTNLIPFQLTSRVASPSYRLSTTGKTQFFFFLLREQKSWEKDTKIFSGRVGGVACVRDDFHAPNFGCVSCIFFLVFYSTYNSLILSRRLSYLGCFLRFFFLLFLVPSSF